MKLSFFTKKIGRRLQLISSFGKRFSYVRDACQYKDKVYQADIYRKSNTCTSCVFNGFKYICSAGHFKIFLMRLNKYNLVVQVLKLCFSSHDR